MALRFSPTRGAASLVLNALVRGPQGNAATLSMGTTSTLAAGAAATTSNSGSSGAAVLNLGIPRGADGGLKFAFDTSTTMDAPASGGVRFNNATPASITQVAISATDADGNIVRPYMLTWDDSNNPTKGAIIFKKEATGAAIILLINGTITDNTTWLQIPVTWSSGGTLFSAADSVYARPDVTGNKGNDGSLAGPGVSVDSEVALFSGTSGTTLKRATGSGLAKLTSGVLGTASAGTDYAPATSGAAILKGNGAGGFSAAAAGTDYMKPDTTSNLTAGFTTTSVNAGTKSSGTFTPDPTAGNIQHYTNGGAHTLAAPSSPCTIIVECTNSSAGAITFSGFSIVDGDVYSSTGTKKHLFYITKMNSSTRITVVYVTGT